MPAPSSVDEYLAALADPPAEIASWLADRLSHGLPGATAQIWHGHPVWFAGKTPVAGFKAYPVYVTLLLWRGQAIEDATGRLVGSGSAEMASVKLHDPAALDGGALDEWLRQLRDLGAR